MGGCEDAVDSSTRAGKCLVATNKNLVQALAIRGGARLRAHAHHIFCAEGSTSCESGGTSGGNPNGALCVAGWLCVVRVIFLAEVRLSGDHSGMKDARERL